MYFKHAYANYPGRNDSLRILISADCGATWQTIFYKGGNSLRTVPTTYMLYFYPANFNQWKIDTISLAAYSGEVLIRFRCINRNGNNLYLDDINIKPLSVGIGEVAMDNTAIHVYPNPATDQLSIILPKNLIKPDVIITDISGKILYTTFASETEKIVVNLRNFEAGIYLVQIQNMDLFETRKFVVLNQ